MKSILHKLMLLLGLGTLSAHAAAPSDAALQKEIKRQYQTTRVDTVLDYPGQPSAYKSDRTPETLEIVFLTGPGQSHIRGDGEVLFLSADAMDADQEKWISQAFELRARKALAATKPKKR
jgi:hypothetical protein